MIVTLLKTIFDLFAYIFPQSETVYSLQKKMCFIIFPKQEFIFFYYKCEKKNCSEFKDSNINILVCFLSFGLP